MSLFSEALMITSTGMNAQATRLRTLSENIANADTPGYQRKTIAFEPFRTEGGGTAVEPGDVLFDKAPLRSIHDPSHPLSDESGHYKGSNVDLIIEMADAREAQRSYEANLKMFDQTRNMSAALLDLLRR